MISANGGLPAHRYTPQVTPRWPRGSEPASGELRAVSREVGDLPSGCWGVFGPWQCGWAVVERVVEVVVPHGFCLHDPGPRGLRCVWTVGGSLAPVECRVEGLPRGTLSACDSDGLEESLPASRGVLGFYFWGVGLGCHEDPCAQCRTHHWASALRM